MSYVPFSLRYRPQTFEEIVGQEHVSRTLQNAVASGRVVHAYLFAGPRGTGKTSTARVLAKALLCEKGPTPHPCGECSICRAIAENRALDVVEIDAASNRGIEQIRELREKVRYSPAEARYKLYILDEVHMLTPEAFNALLKTLEEPPPHAFFVLATTELHKVPPTIVSRCQLFEFHLIGHGQIVDALRQIADEEGVEAEDAALEEIARAAGGALRDAESILDQTIAYADGGITVELVREVLGATPRDAVVGLVAAMAASDLADTLMRLDRLVAEGKDLPQLLQDIVSALREMLRASLGVDAGEEWGELYEAARQIGPVRLAEALRMLGEAEKRMRDATQQQVFFELAMTEILQLWSSGERARASESARAVASRSREQGRPDTTRAKAKPRQRRARSPRRLQPEAKRSEEQQAAEPPPSAPSQAAPVSSAPPAAAQAQPEEPAEEKPQPGAGQAPEPELTPSDHAAGSGSGAIAGAEDLASRWEEVHLQLKRMKRVAVWALLQKARPVALEDDVLTLRFDSQWKFHCDGISGPYRAVAEEVLSAVLGRKVRVRCLLGDEVSVEGQPEAGAPEPAQPTLPAEQRSEPAPPAQPEPKSAPEDTEHKPPAQPPAPEKTDDAVQRAVELTLDFFDDSEELPPE